LEVSESSHWSGSDWSPLPAFLSVARRSSGVSTKVTYLLRFRPFYSQEHDWKIEWSNSALGVVLASLGAEHGHGQKSEIDQQGDLPRQRPLFRAEGANFTA
jgi:hypothetical protein